MKKIILSLSAGIAAVAIFPSCSKWLEVEPDGVILSDDALKTPEDMQLLLNSCYDVLGNVFDGGIQNINEMLSDNLAAPLNNLDFKSVYDREVTFFNTTTNNVYTDLYRAVYRCNTLLANFDLIEGLSDSERIRMEAEARFIRGMCHWWVLKTWAQPWGYTADNSHLGIVLRELPTQDPLPRSTVKESYDFIMADLQFAESNLPANNGAYATSWAAKSLLAFVHFQKWDFSAAYTYADQVINSGLYEMQDNLDQFHAQDSLYQFESNPETIFGIVSYVNFDEGIVDIRNDGYRENYWPGTAGAQLSASTEFWNFINLNPADGRIAAWLENTGSQYQVTRFGTPDIQSFFFPSPLLRLTHMKLIRAESLCQLNDQLDVAIDDINDIRDRAFGDGINELPGTATVSEIRQAARDEFRKETIGEGLWVDYLRRIGAMGEETVTIRDAPWNCPGMAIQFPNSEGTGVEFVFNEEGGCN
ncbi:MAG: RagB/SusD family nutrient uptake outer membrane protein [Flavobacteriales bacterium]|nr:RagB/SusD family nutrient uptake outer membrane protein [Flavobacteriales bacterium]